MLAARLPHSIPGPGGEGIVADRPPAHKPEARRTVHGQASAVHPEARCARRATLQYPRGSLAAQTASGVLGAIRGWSRLLAPPEQGAWER